MSHRVLGEQFLDHQALGRLRASDFPGDIGDPDPVGRMENWREKFPTMSRQYDEGDGPTARVEKFRGDMKKGDEFPPIRVNHWKQSGYMSIEEGHHRAVAAHLEGRGAKAIIHEWDDI